MNTSEPLEWQNFGTNLAPYSSPWKAYGAPWTIPAYCRDGQWVHFRGLLGYSSAPPAAVVGIALVPVGFRPRFRTMFACRGVGTSVRVEVHPDGSFIINLVDNTPGQASFVSLDGISYEVGL